MNQKKNSRKQSNLFMQQLWFWDK